MNCSRWRESAGRSARAAGLPGVLGITLALAALSFDLSGNQALEAEADALHQQTRATERRLRQPARMEPSARARLEAFNAAFPEAGSLPELLGRLHGHALARGVQLDKADYRSAADPQSPLERISLELPARGAYVLLRAWLDDVLAEMPEVALEHLSLRRPAMDATELEARVRLVILVRRGA